MVIRVCGAILGRVGGVPRSFSTSAVCSALGPIRYNPQVPASAKPTRRETSDDAAAAGVSFSQPTLPKWKRRAPRTDKEWGLSKTEEQKRFGNEQDEDVGRDASAEMERLKAEMTLKDSRTQHSQASISSSQKREEIVSAVAQEADAEDVAAVPAFGDLEKIPFVARHPSFGNSGLFYGDGRKFEGLESASSNSNPSTKNPLRGSGLFHGYGRKFEGLATDHLEDAAEDLLFKAEEDKTIAKEKQAARGYCLRLLAMAPQSAHKLRQKLIGRSVSAPVIESTIADLQRCGLQCDLEYAEAFARSRWRSSLWGPQRLKQELKQRGVCPEDVATALEKVFTRPDACSPAAAEEEEGGVEAAVWGMTSEARDHLLEKARQQWARGGGRVSAEARKRRMVGWVQRRGFNWSITAQVLKVLESEESNREGGVE